MSPLRFALPLLLMPALALAATPIDETRPLSPGADVVIDNLKGRIVVRSWDRDEAHLGGSLGEGVEKLVVEGGGQRLLVRVEYPRGGGWFGWGGAGDGEPTTLELTLPARLGRLDIESVSADQDVSGIEATALKATTVSGDLRIVARAGEARIESVSGDQHLEIATASLRTESVSGDVRVSGDVSGVVHAEAVSGDIDVRAGQLQELDASTVSGDIDVQASLAAAAGFRIEALSGDVSLSLPESSSMRLEASSFSGRIRSDIGTVETAEHGPGRSLQARTGSGDGSVRLETFSGSIDLRLR